MNRRLFRNTLLALLGLSLLFAAWGWFRPYEWGPDQAARCVVKGVGVTRDRSFFWLDVRLKVNPAARHDLRKPVRLATAGGRELEPADTTFSSAGGDREIWFRFWLEAADLQGPLVLRLNDGALSLKSSTGFPDLENAAPRYFTSPRW